MDFYNLSCRDDKRYGALPFLQAVTSLCLSIRIKESNAWSDGSQRVWAKAKVVLCYFTRHFILRQFDDIYKSVGKTF